MPEFQSPRYPFRKSAPVMPTLLVAMLAAGCSTLQPVAVPAAAGTAPAAVPPAAATSAAAAPGLPASAAVPPGARPADPTTPKPFAEVIREAARSDGFVPVWRKDEKAWLEIAPEQLNQPFLLTVNISQSVGERGLYASQMGPAWLVEWRRIGNTMQLVAMNTEFRPGPDQATRESVRQAFSESLIGSTPVVSGPHAERKSVLVDAGFLLADLMSYSTRLEAAYRLSFSLDRGNSHFEATRAEPGLTSLNARLHFSTPRLPAPPLVPSPVSQPTPPTTTPDPRSLFVGVVYSLTRLPEQPMPVRLADPRLGHFTESYRDFSGDLKANQNVNPIARWRLEKKDPAAAVSEPVKPITFWLDRNIPQRYRAAVTAGVLEWNKAFERIGFRNAVVVRQQPDDAAFDTLDAGHASIRWFVGADVGFAIGPRRSDPRTGEIIDADIGMSDVFTRGARRLVAEDLGGAGVRSLDPLARGGQGAAVAACDYLAESGGEYQFARDLLEARGDLAPDSPEAEAFVQSVVKDVIMHEVGHTLGLKHNFKASTAVTRAQLQDKSFTESHGISASVMDYNAYNLPLRGEAGASMNNTTLGDYDYWAIEYAYRPLALDQEAAELQKIASRSTEPTLVYADDADAEGGPTGGLDPLANRFDLGDDPLAWYQRRLALSRELWTRVQARGAQAGDDPLRARRILASGFRQLRNLPEMVAKYVGGMQTVRDLPGTTGRPAYQPVAPARQREALKFLSEAIFSVESFRFRPEFLASLQPDYTQWERDRPVSIPATVLALQNMALERLLSPGTAQRVLELPAFLPEAQRKGVLSLDEVYGTLQSAVWSELGSGQDIDGMRRNLQREHLRRVQAMLTRGGNSMPADAISLLRWQAVKLQAALATAVRSGASRHSVETQAHLAESLSSLTEALRATMSRS